MVFDNGNSNLRRDTWVTPDYSMGTLTVDMNRDYIALIDQNRVMGIMFASGVNDRIMVFGKGGSDPTKSFADTTGVTREDCMIVQRDKNATSGGNATQVFIAQAAWDNRVESGGWFFTQLGNAYCALRPAGGGYTAESTASGYYLTLGDLWAPVIIQSGQAGDYASFADFQSSVQANALSYVSGIMNYTSEAGDTFTFYANSKTTPKVNGSTVNLNPTKTYDSPYLSMVHGEEVATVSYTGYADLELDFGADPSLESTSLSHQATGVAVDANLVATFSEPLQAGMGFWQLRRASDGSLVESFDVSQAGEVVINGNQVTLNPSADLEPGSGYYVTIDSGAVEDLRGNAYAGLSQSSGWSFTSQSQRAIAVVNTGSTVVTSGLGNSSTSYSFDAGAVAEWLMVAISTERSTEALYSVSYDGHALTPALESVQAGIWFVDLRQTSYSGGAATLVVDFSGVATVNGVAIGAVSVEANGYDLEVHATASGAESANLVTTVDETFQLASFNANRSGSPTVHSPLTTVYASGNIGSAQGAAGYQTGALAGNHDCGWSTSDKRKAVAAAFVAANSYANWTLDYQLGAESAWEDDPDGDRFSNALEAWFGTHPGQFSHGITNVATNGTVMTFTHPVAASVPDNLQTSFQWSMNLRDWYAADGADGPLTGQRLAADTQIQQGRANVTLTASESMDCLFVRPVAVERP